MLFDWTATHDEDATEFGGTVSAQPDGDDYRPVFAAAREVAAEQAERNGYPPDSFAVTAISYTN